MEAFVGMFVYLMSLFQVLLYIYSRARPGAMSHGHFISSVELPMPRVRSMLERDGDSI